MTLLTRVLCTTLIVGFASDAYMYLCVRKELSTTNERLEKHFDFHRSQAAWMRTYLNLARSRDLPVWPVYTHWLAWLSTIALLAAFLYRRGALI